jgi:Fur family transcriptional regulator, ferric uptake regulator
MTRAQRAVLDALAEDPAFRSAQDVHALIRSRGGSVGLTSVYRALQSLADGGQVDVRRTAAGEATYRRCGTGRHHHHLVCTECGATVEVEAPALERWVTQLADRHGYLVDGHTLEVSGRCGRCARPS